MYLFGSRKSFFDFRLRSNSNIYILYRIALVWAKQQHLQIIMVLYSSRLGNTANTIMWKGTRQPINIHSNLKLLNNRLKLIIWFLTFRPQFRSKQQHLQIVQNSSSLGHTANTIIWKGTRQPINIQTVKQPLKQLITWFLIFQLLVGFDSNIYSLTKIS